MWNIFKSFMHKDSFANFWPVETDLQQNWRYYMTESNPENLQAKSKKRLGKSSVDMRT